MANHVGSVNWLNAILHELGMTRWEFEMEVSRLELSPREWMEKRLAKLGYVRAPIGLSKDEAA